MGRLAVLLLFGVGCASPKAREAPSWFPLGGEVYHARERTPQQATVLAIRAEDRWFLGLPAGKAPAYPTHLSDLPRISGGTSLSLEVHHTDDPAVLRIELQLRAGERQVWREVEHRWTNTVPFLFGFYADGKPVRMKCTEFAKFGGVCRFVPLVAAGEQRRWSLRAEVASVEALLGECRPRTLEVVAAFSERQHQPYLREGERPLAQDLAAPFPGPPILIRSNIARVKWSK